MNINPSIIEIDGVDYEGHPATVNRWELDTEDHGIFTWNIDFDLATGGSQGFGGYALDAPNGDWNGTGAEDRPWTSVKTRKSGLFAGEAILCLTKILGSPGTKGQTILALKEACSGLHGYIVGIATLKGDFFLPRILSEYVQNLNSYN